MSSTSRAGRHDPSACLSIYDGTIMAGFVVVRGQRFHVFGAGGEPIGVFDDLRSAVRAAPPHPKIPAAQVVGRTADLVPEVGDPPRS